MAGSWPSRVSWPGLESWTACCSCQGLEWGHSCPAIPEALSLLWVSCLWGAAAEQVSSLQVLAGKPRSCLKACSCNAAVGLAAVWRSLHLFGGPGCLEVPAFVPSMLDNCSSLYLKLQYEGNAQAPADTEYVCPPPPWPGMCLSSSVVSHAASEASLRLCSRSSMQLMDQAPATLKTEF